MLLKNVRIVTPDAVSNPQDLRLRDGVIAEIGTGLSAAAGEEILDVPGAFVSAGWCDLGTQTGDPGFEHREDLRTVAAAAQAGGFTHLAPFPNTQPAIHSKSEVLYVKNKTAGWPVHFHPIGAISHDAAGKDLAELHDMHAAGAVAFSDGSHPVQDAGLLLRALQYASAFKGLIINQPHHKTVAGGGQMHEGVVSTSLGLRGIPALAEELTVQRDLSLLEYASGTRLHLHLLSSAKSVALVRAAKAAGLPVTASVAIANLCFTDEVLAMTLGGDDLGGAFDSQWKVLPPLRAETDRQALLAGVADGTIDVVCSNHAPWDEEAKNLEFPYAEFGMNALATFFSLYATHLYPTLSLSHWVEKVAVAPRRLLGLPTAEIKVGAPADLTVFDPTAEWILRKEDLHSRSANSPFLGKTLRGKVIQVSK